MECTLRSRRKKVRTVVVVCHPPGLILERYRCAIFSFLWICLHQIDLQEEVLISKIALDRMLPVSLFNRYGSQETSASSATSSSSASTQATEEPAGAVEPAKKRERKEAENEQTAATDFAPEPLEPVGPSSSAS